MLDAGGGMPAGQRLCAPLTEARGFCPPQRTDFSLGGREIRMRSPSAFYPSAFYIQVLSIQVLSIQVPSIQVPSIQVPSIQVSSIQVPSIQVPSMQVPSIQMLAVANPYWDSLGRLNGLVQICNMRCAAYRARGMGLGSRPPSHGFMRGAIACSRQHDFKSSMPACERDLVKETWLKRLGCRPAPRWEIRGDFA